MDKILTFTTSDQSLANIKTDHMQTNKPATFFFVAEYGVWVNTAIAKKTACACSAFANQKYV